MELNLDGKMIVVIIIAILAMVVVVFALSTMSPTGQLTAATTPTTLPGMIGGC